MATPTRRHGRRPAKLATQPIGSGPHTSLVYWLQEVIKADKADYEIVELGIDATQRAEELSVEQFCALARAFAATG